MKLWPSVLVVVALLSLAVCGACVYAQLLSGYSGVGIGGLRMPNDKSLRATFGSVAFLSLSIATISSCWAAWIASGMLRWVATVPLLLSMAALSFVMLGAIY